MFSCKQGQTSGSNIAKKCSGGNFVKIQKIIVTTKNTPRNYLVIISARDRKRAEYAFGEYGFKHQTQ